MGHQPIFPHFPEERALIERPDAMGGLVISAIVYRHHQAPPSRKWVRAT